MLRKRNVYITVAVIIVIMVLVMLFHSGADNSSSPEKGKKHQKTERIKAENSSVGDQMDEIYKALPGIAFWGDSQTTGSCGDGVTFPGVVEKLINCKIISRYDSSLSYDHIANEAVPGEDTLTIAGRVGARPFTLIQDTIIPYTPTKAAVYFRSPDGQYVSPLHNAVVSMGGVTGTLITRHTRRRTPETNRYYFKREHRGKEATASSGSVIEFHGYDKYADYINVLFLGENGTYSSDEDLIEQEKEIVQALEGDSGRYIIIGMHTGTREKRRNLERQSKKAFGSHYINLRRYMSKKALKAAGIAPDEKDRVYAEKGKSAPALRAGFVHFNSVGYALLGNLVYDRCERLGYFDDLKKICGVREKHTSDVNEALSGINVKKTVEKSRRTNGLADR